MNLLFSFFRKINSYMPPEFSHQIAVFLLARNLLYFKKEQDDPRLATSIAGMDLSNPIGLAAGFDKNGEAIRSVIRIGFGFVEIGSVTPLPQFGNKKPRLYRLTEDIAVINRMGFNNLGYEKILRKLKENNKFDVPLGINLGANKNSENKINDYVLGVNKFAKQTDYITINISSPNTPGLRSFHELKSLSLLLNEIISNRGALCEAIKLTPIFLKISPDLDARQFEELINLSLDKDIQGLIISNTTIKRPASLKSKFKSQEGGLSGKPLMQLSTKLLAEAYKLSKGKLCLIGAGGISSGEDAYAKICAGASAVQLYTAFSFFGPELIKKIKNDIIVAMDNDGVSSIAEAVGSKVDDYL